MPKVRRIKFLEEGGVHDSSCGQVSAMEVYTRSTTGLNELIPEVGRDGQNLQELIHNAEQNAVALRKVAELLTERDTANEKIRYLAGIAGGREVVIES